MSDLWICTDAFEEIFWGTGKEKLKGGKRAPQERNIEKLKACEKKGPGQAGAEAGWGG